MFQICCIYMSYRMNAGLRIKNSKFKHSWQPNAFKVKKPIGRFQKAIKNIEKGQEIKINWCLTSTPNDLNEENPFLSLKNLINLIAFCREICDVVPFDQMGHYMHMCGLNHSTFSIQRRENNETKSAL